MGLLISIWGVCFIILFVWKYWGGVVAFSKKIAGWITISTSGWWRVLLGFPLIAIPVLLILAGYGVIDASVLVNIGVYYLILMLFSFVICFWESEGCFP